MISDKIQQCIEDQIHSKIVASNSVGGGCIADSRILKSEKGEHFFLKCGFSGDMFLKEANSLKELAKPALIRVPRVIISDNEFLLLEYIPSGRKGPHFFATFGQQLAKLH